MNKVTLETKEFKQWFIEVRTILDEWMGKNFPEQIEALVVSEGRRFIKVIKQVKYKTVEDGKEVEKVNSESAFAFIDKTNGDVLKPATWTAPAKHARGNIFNPDNGVKCMGPYGPAYLR